MKSTYIACERPYCGFWPQVVLEVLSDDPLVDILGRDPVFVHLGR